VRKGIRPIGSPIGARRRRWPIGAGACRNMT
jgi:hypothetical protein